jgi:hypothetical protein
MPTERPRVYLDHCGLRTICDRSELARSFSQAINSKPATWCISCANLIEFTKVSISETAQSAESMLNRHLKRLALIEMDPFKPDETPIHDLKLADAVVHLPPSGFEQLTMERMLEAVRDAEIDRTLGPLFLERIQTLRDKYNSDDEFRRKVDRFRDIGEPTSIGAVRALTRVLVRDLTLGLTENDAMDFYHAAVPLAYCDLVVVDSKWSEVARQASSRVSGMARIVSIKRIDELPSMIENWVNE